MNAGYESDRAIDLLDALGYDAATIPGDTGPERTAYGHAYTFSILGHRHLVRAVVTFDRPEDTSAGRVTIATYNH